MSTLQYIEFSSDYRDRLTWKNPAEFEIKFEEFFPMSFRFIYCYKSN